MKRLFLILFALILLYTSKGQSYTWKNVNFQGTGYVDGIAIHPVSNDIYIRTDVGGVYRRDVANSSWIPITDGKIAYYGVEALALNPSNENEVFIVVGVNWGLYTGMLYKSSDKGGTWQQLSNFTVPVSSNDAWRNDDPRLSIDPNNGGKVMFFASRQNGLWKSTNSGVNWIKIASTVIPVGTSASGGQAFIVFDKNSGNLTTNSTTIYVGVSGIGNGIYKSIDGGTSFSLLTGGPDATIYNPVNGSLSSDGNLYVTYAQGWSDTKDGRVYKFSTSGTGVNITPPVNNGKSFGGINVCPTDPNKIVTIQWNWGNVKGIHYSSDAGTTWNTKTCTAANFNCPPWWDKNFLSYDYCAGIAFDPVTPNKVWFTFGGGVFITNDITAANPVYNVEEKNLEELCVVRVCVPPSPSTTKLVATVLDQQGFAFKDVDQVPKVKIGTGFGQGNSIDYCAVNPDFFVRVADDQQWTKPTGYGQYSTDGAVTWKDFTTKPLNSASGNVAVSAINQNNWVWAPLNCSVNALNVMPWYTTNGGINWQACSGIPVGDNVCSQVYAGSKYLVSDRVNGSVFYYYSYDNTNTYFYRSTDGGASFTKISTNVLPGYYQVKLESMPGSEKNLMFCTRNGSPLYYSINGGDTWSKIAGVSNCFSFGFGKAIGTSPNLTLFVNATIKNVSGVYYSTDMGLSWSANLITGNVPATCSDISGDLREEYTVYIGTTGRGVIYGKLVNATGLYPEEDNYKLALDIKIFPNPLNLKGNSNLTIEGIKTNNVDVNLCDMNGKIIDNLNYSQVLGNQIHYQLPSSLIAGTYILTLKSGSALSQMKLMIQ